jgi:hypothetical protein
MSAKAGQEVIRLLYTEDSPHDEGSEEGRHDEDSPRAKREDERLAAFDAEIAEIAARVLPAYRATEGWLERTRAGLIALLVALDERPVAARALVIDSIAWGPAVLERRGELLEVLAQALEEGRAESATDGETVRTQSDPERSGQLPETTGENLIGASLSWAHKQLAREDGALVELAPSLMSTIVHPYLGSEAAQRELERSHTEVGATLAGREQPDPISAPGAVASRSRSSVQGASSPQSPISRPQATPS